jgi:hypothetical protein
MSNTHRRATPSHPVPASTDARERRSEDSELQWLENLTRLLDSQFQIPGTKIRFGADFLLGLVPGAGDMLSMGVSGILIATMAKKGASGRLVSRMILNVLLDTIVGSVPVLGNFFDLFYKANQRNMKLMREHYQQGKHTGSGWPIFMGVATVFLLLFVLVAIVIALVLRFLWNVVTSGST